MVVDTASEYGPLSIPDEKLVPWDESTFVPLTENNHELSCEEMASPRSVLVANSLPENVSADEVCLSEIASLLDSETVIDSVT